MRGKIVSAGIALLGLFVVATTAQAESLTESLKSGTPDIQSAGPLAFGPEGILFASDIKGAAIFALATGENSGAPDGVSFDVSDIGSKIAGLLGTSADKIQIKDLAVSPATGNVYLSVARGLGPDATGLILKVEPSGTISEFSLDNVLFSKVSLSNAPNAPEASASAQNSRRPRRDPRQSVITDLAYLDGKLFVSGLSNEEFASKLRTIPFPFSEAEAGTSINIYHTAHGQWETRSPVQTFTPYEIDSEPYLLAAYTCTPLVKIPVSKLESGTKIIGETIAELGNRNQPLDMIPYQKEGEDYLLLSNSARGVMKLRTSNIGTFGALTDKVGGGGQKGVPYETIGDLEGIVQMDRLNGTKAVAIFGGESGALTLKSIDLP